MMLVAQARNDSMCRLVLHSSKPLLNFCNVHFSIFSLFFSSILSIQFVKYLIGYRGEYEMELLCS